MAVVALYGVKAQNISNAIERIQSLLDVAAEERDSLNFGGTYYRFSGNSGEVLKLVENVDPTDGEPVFGAAEGWRFAARLEGAPPGSAFLTALNGATDLVEMIETRTYGE